MLPRDDQPIESQLRVAEEKLHMFEALDDALSEPGVLWELLTKADDTEHARQLLQDHYGFDDVQVAAVLDLQFRRASTRQRHLIAVQRRELPDLIRELRAMASRDGD